MGTCFSKKTSPSSSLVIAAAPPAPNPISNPKLAESNNTTKGSEETVKKEIFIIKQRKSHDRRAEEIINVTTAGTNVVLEGQSSSPTSSIEIANANVVVDGNVAKAAPVRTSSCTKEEVDAILIQCGRLSRSSSGKASNSCEGGGGRKYSGSKRSYDFDQDNKKYTDGDNEQVEEDEKNSRSSHRRTPSREKDAEYKRSGSRHRSSSTSREEERKRQNGGSTSRRLSRSPGRRSETTPSSTTPAAAGDKSKGPAKMVSVPASTTGAIKRVSVKRATASPRSQSPANARENGHHQTPSLSRNSSRKGEHSPYRRNPLSEIDDNCLISEQLALKQQDHPIKKPIGTNSNMVLSTKEDHEGGAAKKPFNFQSHSEKPEECNGGMVNVKSAGKNQVSRREEEERLEANELHRSQMVTAPKGSAEIENLVPPQTITRSRSSRRSRDLDYLNNGFNLNSNNVDDAVVNVPSSYASLLLEDIQNFHQKSSTNTAFSLPPCVTKACSILDAVADLNSSTNSTLSEASNNDSSHHNISSSSAHFAEKRLGIVNKEPFVETEVFVYDDIMEPSIHKYITVRRGATDGVELEQQESSGSNSVVGQQWFSSSSWEPSSADSTDQWTSSSNTGDEVVVDKEEASRLFHKKKAFSDGPTKLRSSGNCSTLLNSAATGSAKKERVGST